MKVMKIRFAIMSRKHEYDSNEICERIIKMKIVMHCMNIMILSCDLRLVSKKA